MGDRRDTEPGEDDGPAGASGGDPDDDPGDDAGITNDIGGEGDAGNEDDTGNGTDTEVEEDTEESSDSYREQSSIDFDGKMGDPSDYTEGREPPEWVEEVKRESGDDESEGDDETEGDDESVEADEGADESDDGDESDTDEVTGDEITAADPSGGDADDGADDDADDDAYEIGPSEASAVRNEAAPGGPAGHDPVAAGAGGGGGGGGGALGGATAPDDEEMPLTEHVEEMALRFMAVGLVVVGVGAITLFYADELINFLWYSFLGPGQQTCLEGSFLGGRLSVTDACPDSVSPRIYHPLALVLARLKVASLVGIIAALPVAVYQTYRFMRPGLYPRERRYYLAAVPTSLVLAAVGVGFAYFAVLPAMFSYFTNYSEQAAEIAFGLTETFNLIVLMIGFFAIVFQIPLLVMLAIMMGVTTRRWLEDRRLYFWGGFGALAFVFSPDPTGMAPLMVAVTMIGLFEGTLFLLRWTDSDSPLFDPAAFAERRPYAWALAVAAGYLASAAPLPGSYYEQFPALVQSTLEFNDLVAMTPIITAVVLIGLFELLAYLVRNYSRNVRVWDVVNRARVPYWILALVVGYFASPNPPGLQTVEALALPQSEAVAVTAGLIVGFELLILTLRWRKQRME
ncbi:sec-independent protein translocase protein TatC [Halomicrobium zhouii]|uniref:Sec-independent protein translocase protein TatC n=1 Tax=Halomicrobium zhouii TaxID=767519 RepID=A0A1I6K2X2_9EURY|nr:twin-arginine translocase subunit TatC [Halomicrobium zhouii]SFR85524.1 sec-independent protein translocase protein TatC [Halomicrobium zhouii]